MADQLRLEIVTPRRQLLETETAWVTIPGSAGELGILPEHVPLLTTIASGVLRYGEGGQEQRVAVHYGYAQVSGDRVTVLAEMAETPAEIDAERARKARERAEQELRDIIREKGEESRFNKYEAKLHRALVRIDTGR